jgi:adenylate cyclase
MPAEKYKRKLSAILSADVKGYSRLMGKDEEGTISTLNVCMGVINGFIQQHRGRVVSTGGDSVLAEFASVVDAVRCAVGIQEELKDRNKELAEDKRMEFRIGVNLGDVVEEGDNILGDGVNVAARIQSLAEAGGICISGTAYDQVKNKLAFSYEYVGEQTVKNIKEPVRVYRVRMDPEAVSANLGEEKKPVGKGLSKSAMVVAALVLVIAALVLWQFVLRPSSSKIEVASKEKTALPLADVPSIAVLPFVNMSDDPQQAYLADGLAEEIINALTKLPKVLVIARTSSFAYKGKTVDVKQVGRELGVQYVLEGSVRREGNRIRITAQLIDATTGNHVFSERYERELQGLFAIQDDVTIKVVSAMRVKWTYGEQERMLGKGTKNLEAYMKILQGYEYMQSFNKESLAKYKQLAEEAIALDPNYAVAYTSLAGAIANQTFLGVYKDPKEAMERAIALGQKAVAIDDSSGLLHSRLGWLYGMNKEFDKGIAEAERAVALEPNSAEAIYFLAVNLSWARPPAESLPYFKNALRLSPIPPWPLLHNMAVAYRDSGQYEEAIAMFRKIFQKWPQAIASHAGCAAALAMAGRLEEARAEAAEVMRIDPKFSLESFTNRFPWKDQARLDRFIEASRKAGLK